MSDTLESIGTAAATWRSTRKGQGLGERLPDVLKRRAVNLLDRHTPRELAQVLGMSDPRLLEGWRDWLGNARRQPSALAPVQPGRARPAFLEIALPPEGFAADLHAQAAELQLELVGEQGRVLRLRGKLDAATVRSLAELTVQTGARA